MFDTTGFIDIPNNPNMSFPTSSLPSKYTEAIREAMVRDGLAILEAYEPQFPSSHFIQRADGMLAEIQTPIHFDDERGEDVYDTKAVLKWYEHLKSVWFYLDGVEGVKEDSARNGPATWFHFSETYNVHCLITRTKGDSGPVTMKVIFQFTVTLFNHREDKHPPVAEHVDAICEWYRGRALYWSFAAEHFTVQHVGGDMFEAAIYWRKGQSGVEEGLAEFIEREGECLEVGGAVFEVLACVMDIRMRRVV